MAFSVFIGILRNKVFHHAVIQEQLIYFYTWIKQKK
jgi:hypothetical protein